MHIRWEEISRSAVIVDGTVSNKLVDAEYTIFQEWTNTGINISSTWKVHSKPPNDDSECIKRHQKAIYPWIFKTKAIRVDVAALGIVNNAWRRRSDNDYNSLVEQFGDWLYAIMEVCLYQLLNRVNDYCPWLENNYGDWPDSNRLQFVIIVRRWVEDCSSYLHE